MDVVESMFIQLYERVKFLESGDKIKFTNNERMLVKLSFNAWTGGDHSAKGFEMFLKMFQMHPETQKLFEFARGSSAAQLQNSSRMLFHVTRVIKNIGMCTQNLDSLENVVPVFKELGGRHVQYGVPGNFFPYLGEAMRALMKAQLKNWTPAHEKLWTRVWEWMSARLAEGEAEYGNK